VFWLCRFATHAVVALALVAASLVAPEHAHEAAHSPTIIHHHVEFHDHDAAAFDDLDGHVVWLTSSALHVAKNHVQAPVGVIVERFVLRSVALTRANAPLDIAAPAHGPPRALVADRAPPALPV
jgi:hypothetical protein